MQSDYMKKTGGISIDAIDFVEKTLKHIYGEKSKQFGAYNAIIATGYHTVVLDKPLTEHDMELAEKLYDDPEYAFSEEEVKDCADTDRDGLFDFEEVMFYSDYIKGNEFIKFDNGKIDLPQVADILRIFEVNGEYTYVDGGVENARKQYGDYWTIFLTKPVLPIISDPTSVDGDGDGFEDCLDPNRLIINNRYNRAAVDLYASIWAESVNEEYPKPEVFGDTDCANFVSQCLIAGGYPMHNKWYVYKVSDIDITFPVSKIISILADRNGINETYVNYGWRMSTTWGKASLQYSYFSSINPDNVITVDDYKQINSKFFAENNIQIGDLLYFCSGEDAAHAAIITGFDEDNLLYSGHTNSRNDYVLSDFSDSYTHIKIVKIEDALPCGKEYIC